MRRALILIVLLSLVGFGAGYALDRYQQATAREYLVELDGVRQLSLGGQEEEARREQAYLYARWQGDEKWLNFLLSHQYTRAVTTAFMEMTTAMEQGWDDETLRSLNDVYNALREIEHSDFATLENVF